MPLRNLYIASFQYGNSPPWVARHGLSSSAYQAAFNQFVGQGFRLRCVSGHAGPDGVSRYAAIWDQSPSGAWVARHGLSPQQYQTSFNQLTAQGFRPRLVNAHAIGNQERYACIFEKVGGPPWAARHGLDGTQYQQVFNQLTAQGYRLRWLSVHAMGSTLRYACVFQQGAGPAWVGRHGLEESAFRTISSQLAAQGYDLICGNAASIAGKDYYCGLWEQRPETTLCHHGMTSETYQLKFDQLVGTGYVPRFVAGYAGADPVDVRLRFAMQQQQQGNWCWAATAASVDAFYNVGTTMTQCQIANIQKGVTNCCTTGASTAPCNTYGFLDAALTTVGHFSSLASGTTSFADVESQMLAGRPLGIRVAWSGGGAHFIAATGTEDDGSVWVSDCGSGTTSLVPYDTLKTSYNGAGTWTHSYFTQP